MAPSHSASSAAHLVLQTSSPRRTQDMQNLIFENGAIFIFNTRGFYINKNRLFGKIGFFEMEERQSVDLDTKKDLSLLKKIIV